MLGNATSCEPAWRWIEGGSADLRVRLCVFVSGSAAKPLTDGLIQEEPSASCWPTSYEEQNKNLGIAPKGVTPPPRLFCSSSSCPHLHILPILLPLNLTTLPLPPDSFISSFLPPPPRQYSPPHLCLPIAFLLTTSTCHLSRAPPPPLLLTPKALPSVRRGFSGAEAVKAAALDRDGH